MCICKVSTGHAHWVNVVYKSMSWKHSPSVVAIVGVLNSLALVVVDNVVGVISNLVDASDGTLLLNMHQQLQELLTACTQEFHLTNCKCKSASKLVHQYFLCVEVDIDADSPATCWRSTWWD